MQKKNQKALIYIAHHLEFRSFIDKYVNIVTDYMKQKELTIAICRDLECAKLEVADSDMVMCFKFPEELFDVAKQLKWIQFGSAGIDHTLYPKLLASDIILTTVSGIHPIPVAEHVMGQMLALTRKLYIAFEHQRQQEWDRTQIAPTAEELCGKTLGIIGLGKIGLEIARLAKCFGMRVIGTKLRVQSNLPNVDEVLPADKYPDLLRRSDIVVLVVPLTGSTKALIGKTELESMKKGAYIVNVARGAMIDYQALIQSLSTGHIAGAALDVFHQEPLPQDNPLWNTPNVIITPHTAGSSPRYPERAAAIFKKNLDAFLSGGEMVSVFDRKKGY